MDFFNPELLSQKEIYLNDNLKEIINNLCNSAEKIHCFIFMMNIKHIFIFKWIDI